ncbi:Transglycosylase SLT domain protein [Jannaschia seosinensis]|uniref:Transglycosylase SLT domain protein n=1 Tax=Jannaschia seosinensis TaxID=313367 RepID=A0A0M7B834_9RHOB|nr:lytic transglycosylase domain-containing protein [Jannaschia seosinensis]CUH24351.1 Transglycosylase SLT domain protein [Jannaschia seosinensis]
MIRLLLPLLLLLAACAAPPEPQVSRAATATHTLYPGETPEVRKLVNKWADHYAIPRSLLHRVIQRESDYRPGARNGPYWGMMQILPATARNMGMRGDPAQLLDADTALKYSARYLRGAWMVSDGDEKAAMMWYARGFYYEAKKRGLLRATGLRGELWQSYDQGAAKMPAIGPRGRLLPEAPAAPECTRASGLAGLVGAKTCS